jgi:signal transduction histidine kinase
MTRRWRLFPKYALLIITLVGGMLVASGAIGIWFSWDETRAHLVALQNEKAESAATRIEQYILDIGHDMSWTALPAVQGGDPLEQRRLEYLKLQRQAPAITEVVWIDAEGREQLRVSRLAMDAVSSGTDLSKEAKFREVASGRVPTYYGPVYFRKGTEPYMTISRPAGSGGGVTAAEVNLKFVWDVVSKIKIGQAGLAYVVDKTGTLIAHPDISLVLKQSDLSALPQVAALAKPGRASPNGRDLKGAQVFSAHATIPTLTWTVFVDSPREEAFAPLYETLQRTALVLVAALLISIAASFFLARALVRPLRALQQGAAQIGAGDLDRHIEVRTGDELEGLAEQFNHMSAQLKESYAGLERKVAERTAELSEALEHQTAISEVLRAISQSTSDVTPVFEAILDSATRLFGTPLAAIFQMDGDLVHQVAVRNWPAEAIENARRFYPGPPDRRMMSGRVILSGEVQLEEDTFADPGYDQATARLGGWRRMIGAPLLRDGTPVGAIVLAWREPGTTPQRQVDLLRTFASQAVIAIENARLFNETREALERQTATADVLQVISGSMADPHPVFVEILESCKRLFSGAEMGITLIGDDGLLRLAAHLGTQRAAVEREYPRPIDEVALRMGMGGTEVLHIVDVLTEPELPAAMKHIAEQIGTYSILLAPLLWEGRNVGSIHVVRQPTSAFSDKEIGLLKVFADQAVIAIQNARLFNETKEALEQQTATAEVLQVISSSVADTQPVFAKILDSCERLFAANGMGIYLIDDANRIHLGGFRGHGAVTRAATQAVNDAFPRPLEGTATDIAVRERRVVHFPDVLGGAGVPEPLRRIAGQAGNYSIAFAPMLWEGRGVGAIQVSRDPPQPFTGKELTLLNTFADQAVIAVQNSRLFNEIETKSRELELANKHKSEFLANMSHELRTPLNAIIGFSEVLSEKMFGEVNDKQLEYLLDIHTSGHHLLSLINDILDLSKIEAGRMELDLATVNLPMLLDNCTTLVRERASRQGLALALDIEDDVGDWVADVRKVKQIVINLLSNAVKFTPAGGRVTLRARRLGHAVEIAVVDTGVGIAPDQQALVFEEFRQAGGDYLRKSEGTGLGLSLARRFAELHGGSIRVESAPGQGSTFAFILPERVLEAV